MENKVEYERVDSEDDQHRRILAKFDPGSLRESDFEIEFIPLSYGIGFGRAFVAEIDSMSTIDLYRWASRHMCLTMGGGDWKRGAIVPKRMDSNLADILNRAWHSGELELEPRQVISLVKHVFGRVTEGFNRPTAFAYDYFLYSGELGTLPFASEDFNVVNLRKVIEEFPYRCKNANGEAVERPLVEHLFDTHETEYIEGAILNFLWVMCEAASDAITDLEKDLEKEL